MARVPRLWIVIGLLPIVAAQAGLAAPKRVILPDGLRVVIAGRSISVQKENVVAPLDDSDVTRLGRVEFDPASKTVLVRHSCDLNEGCCGTGRWRTSSFKLEQMRARLENERGLRLLRRKNNAEAEKFFSRAFALDETFQEATINRARVLARLGKDVESVRALEPCLKKDSLAIYAKVISTTALRALRDTDRLRSLRTARPGTAHWPAKDGFFLALQRERGLIAVGSTWGNAYTDEECHADLRIFDLRSGALRAIVPAVSGRCIRSAKSKEPANLLLRDWGFAIPDQLIHGRESIGEDPPRVWFKGSGLKLIERSRKDGTLIRLVRNKTVLATTKIAPILPEFGQDIDGSRQKLAGGYLLPSERLVVFFSYYAPAGDGDPCERMIGDAHLIRFQKD